MMQVRNYRALLDHALSLAAAVAALAALYLVTTERLLPALRDAPVRLGEGEQLARVLEFRTLANGHERTGEEIAVPGDRATLLFVFSSTCPACYTNLPAWREVTEAAGGTTTVLAVALERDRSAARSYARRHLSWATAVVPKHPREFVGTLGVDIVPFTALVGRDGVLEFVWPGSLDSLTSHSLIRALGALSASSISWRKDGDDAEEAGTSRGAPGANRRSTDARARPAMRGYLRR
ncbi:MAG: hypothetical protein JSV41_11860 [Gemmatimonadota bacterium]|nr:MAG: hypothetical protein JSV41_11860 [Gemmatimonadota bacterium]